MVFLREGDNALSQRTGTPEEKLPKVQAIAERHLPEIVCELQDYKSQIGGGALDERGMLRDAKWRLRGLTEWRVDNSVRMPAPTLNGRRLAPDSDSTCQTSWAAEVRA
ncbi:MAG: hypothetical protein JO238_16895 [Alphaproteobacteria bacterium]|nr:hypothetical protein [Alphaproteobacteria bacterium]